MDLAGLAGQHDQDVEARDLAAEDVVEERAVTTGAVVGAVEEVEVVAAAAAVVEAAVAAGGVVGVIVLDAVRPVAPYWGQLAAHSQPWDRWPGLVD